MNESYEVARSSRGTSSRAPRDSNGDVTPAAPACSRNVNLTVTLYLFAAMAELIERTNKAEIYRLPDGSVSQRYITENAAERCRQDWQSLRYLQENLPEMHHQGWSYRTVRSLWVDAEQGSLGMEYVTGSPVSQHPRSMVKEAEFHCGIWLGWYHREVLNGTLEGLIYTDFNVHNIIIDFERKSVVALDPGGYWGRVGYAYEDLVQHIHSVSSVMVFRGKACPSAIASFLQGYARASNIKPNLAIYYRSLYREARRQFRDNRRKSFTKAVLVLGLGVVLSPLYLIVVPSYLLLKMRDQAPEQSTGL